MVDELPYYRGEKNIKVKDDSHQDQIIASILRGDPDSLVSFYKLSYLEHGSDALEFVPFRFDESKVKELHYPKDIRRRVNLFGV